jgi:hypothetical protein
MRTEPVAAQTGKRPMLRMNRVVFGLLAVSVGGIWLVDELGVDVPWRVVPPAALLLVGIALLVTLVVGEGRTSLIWLGLIGLGQALVRAMTASLTCTKSSPNLTTNSHKERS